ncbi:MAG: DUF1127 domain-containing protein [Pseudomonadota bacterium]
MAHFDIHHSGAGEFAHRIASILKAGVVGIYEFLVSISTANERVHLVQMLQEKSDTELAELGIRREDIVRYAFRDVIYD